MLDVAWPDGLQPGRSEPVAVLLNEGSQVEAASGRFGYRFFTSAEDFTEYVRGEVLGDDVAALRLDCKGAGRAYARPAERSASYSRLQHLHQTSIPVGRVRSRWKSSTGWRLPQRLHT